MNRKTSKLIDSILLGAFVVCSYFVAFSLGFAFGLQEFAKLIQ